MKSQLLLLSYRERVWTHRETSICPKQSVARCQHQALLNVGVLHVSGTLVPQCLWLLVLRWGVANTEPMSSNDATKLPSVPAPEVVAVMTQDTGHRTHVLPLLNDFVYRRIVHWYCLKVVNGRHWHETLSHRHTLMSVSKGMPIDEARQVSNSGEMLTESLEPDFPRPPGDSTNSKSSKGRQFYIQESSAAKDSPSSAAFVSNLMNTCHYILMNRA